jgi:adsorption protein B
VVECPLCEVTRQIDSAVAACLLPLALWILLSGLDDLVVLLAFLYGWAHNRTPTETAAGNDRQEPMMAIFVPCWREDGVIADMLEHNLSVIRYRRYHFFVGAYPNDEETVQAIQRVESRFTNVHLSLCPHDGPTSKADCLNWIYQRMLLYEDQSELHFDLVLTHDAEDLMHPEELNWIARHAGGYDMIQIPVLALETPLRDLTHGLYCDDFAESHTKDLPARQVLGGFIPSSGVGTAYSRAGLQRLAASESNRVFEPACLTEDYENGLRLKQLGLRQVFLPLQFWGGAPVATREFFPRGFRSAVRQRSRWITGIALQSWERHGWRGGFRQIYWLWRDRKGLIGNPVSLLSNVLFLYGALTYLAARLHSVPWGLAASVTTATMVKILAVTLALQIIHLVTRGACVARIYGLRFALGVPIRLVYGNLLNSFATALALSRYVAARLCHQPLVWVKTEHAYPSRAALLPHKRRLGEILVGSGYLAAEQLERARATKPRGILLGQHLVASGLLTEDELYEALSLQLGIDLGVIDPDQVPRNVARALPARIVREWHVFPVRIESGNLHLVSPDFPTEELQRTLRRHTRLEIRVQLVTPANFRRLADALL